MIEKGSRCVAQERLIRGKGRETVSGLLDSLSVLQLGQVPDSILHGNERRKSAAMGRLRPDELVPQTTNEEHSPALLRNTELLSLEDSALDHISQG